MKPLYGLLLALCIPLTGCASPYPRAYLTKEIAAYTGDGTMVDTSLRFLWARIKGFEIQFPTFTLEKPFSATYTLSTLPELDEHRCRIYLHIIGTPLKSPVGTWHIVTSDETGKILIDVTTRTDSMNWSERINSRPQDTNGYYLTADQLDFEARPTSTYTITATFTPLNAMHGATGALRISSGGNI